MKNNAIIIVLVLALVAAGAYIIGTKNAVPIRDQNSNQNQQAGQNQPNQLDGSAAAKPAGDPTFKWSYAPFEEMDMPRTVISLVATYPGGEVVKKEINTIEGSCNAYENRDADVYQKSEMIICYYAGFGRYYKVVKMGGAGQGGTQASYAVQRKEFEEASPDYNPPVQQFKTVATF